MGQVGSVDHRVFFVGGAKVRIRVKSYHAQCIFTGLKAMLPLYWNDKSQTRIQRMAAFRRNTFPRSADDDACPQGRMGMLALKVWGGICRRFKQASPLMTGGTSKESVHPSI